MQPAVPKRSAMQSRVAVHLPPKTSAEYISLIFNTFPTKRCPRPTEGRTDQPPFHGVDRPLARTRPSCLIAPPIYTINTIVSMLAHFHCYPIKEGVAHNAGSLPINHDPRQSRGYGIA